MPTAHVLSLITKLTSVLVDIAGGLFSLVMVYGGIRFMVAQSPRSVQAAKELMTRAAGGLILILLVDVIRQVIQYAAS
ncbi:MAG: hypothetical protein C7B44_13065 [Sulfobacillus thermosulfidooxidans]|uniref:Uncharacterized protein n=1 Tax=Sulfobacillus thermotolerans TaxID=338644 RepID=A0ABN5H0Y9_9FIRM|nr:pilin [Sulfobacillus sp. hq2]AUW94037.1 hypothetical protein BXT84_08805 [Sulfobacillus thermotolerans]MCY0907955.1 pilin [Sulfobacillus thermotolerans]POB12246.1 hypothetical protein CO251_00370 [Sulfobacillus sp. hq2]PSR35655.1 MAG: hypothetical protein C7B44_13065 [Sulfobacillus thermosulfidooxidans]